MAFKILIALLAAVHLAAGRASAEAGGEAASFLDIPVGARPAGMAGAFTAAAFDSHAVVWNPAGLAWSEGFELSTMHLSHVAAAQYEYAGLAIPITPGRSLGASIQYWRAGDIEALDEVGAPNGVFSGYYGAYSLAYGQKVGRRFSLGATGKVVAARIAEAKAQSWGVDVGGMYRAGRLGLGAVVANMGSGLKFLSQREPAPTSVRLGASYQMVKPFLVALEASRGRRETDAVRLGGEWQPAPYIAFRGGVGADPARGLSEGRVFSAGTGFRYREHGLDYAFTTQGGAGDAHYISLVLRLSGKGGRDLGSSDEGVSTLGTGGEYSP